MSIEAARGFARLSAAIAVAAAVVLVLAGSTRGGGFVAWSLVGWAVPALTGVAGGAWTASRHGTPGAGFLIALQTCILARLALAVAGAFASTAGGQGAIRAYLVGLVAGFIPLQVFEVAWFYKRTATGRAGLPETRTNGTELER